MDFDIRYSFFEISFFQKTEHSASSTRHEAYIGIRRNL